MLAAKEGHEDVVLFLTQKGANLDFVNKVSVNVFVNTLYKSSMKCNSSLFKDRYF